MKKHFGLWRVKTFESMKISNSWDYEKGEVNQRVKTIKMMKKTEFWYFLILNNDYSLTTAVLLIVKSCFLENIERNFEISVFEYSNQNIEWTALPS